MLRALLTSNSFPGTLQCLNHIIWITNGVFLILLTQTLLTQWKLIFRSARFERDQYLSSQWHYCSSDWSAWAPHWPLIGGDLITWLHAVLWLVNTWWQWADPIIWVHQGYNHGWAPGGVNMESGNFNASIIFHFVLKNCKPCKHIQNLTMKCWNIPATMLLHSMMSKLGVKLTFKRMSFSFFVCGL